MTATESGLAEATRGGMIGIAGTVGLGGPFGWAARIC